MSGFQIPGLGHAKPDEKLPPLSPDQTLGAPVPIPEPQSSKDVEIPDAAPAEPQTNGEIPQETAPTNALAEATRTEQPQETNGDAMVVDQPPSPPSITGALEAALGIAPPEPTVVDAEATLAQQNNPTMIEAQAPAAQPDTNGQAQNPEWEEDSSPYESSSSDTTSDDSSDADSDNEGYELLGVEETARMLMEAEGGSDDEGGDKSGKGAGPVQVRSKNELPAESIPKPDVTITPDMKVEELGVVEHVVENMILVKAFTPGEYQVLDTGSVLCNTERTVIGAIAETIGKVLQPMYIVHFESAEDIAACNLSVGSKVLYPVDHANFIFTEPLKNVKGSDASNIHDEEVGDDEMEFSDDEKEAEYKRAKKEQKRKRAGGADRGGGKGPHPLRQEMGPSELNYDDVGDYTPLTRPAGFGDGPVSQEADPSPRGGFRGRGRGEARGRGARGRGSNRGGRGGASRDGYSQPPQSAHDNHHHQQHQQQVPPPPPNWNPQGQNAAPSFPNFGFQMPGWPQPPPAQGNAVPPPPPGWPGAAQGQQQQGGNNSFMNPAFMAALMQHMQSQQGGQQQQQWQPPPPPGSGH